MQTAAIRPAQPLRILIERTLSRWSTSLRSILNSSWYRKNQESKHDSLRRLDERFSPTLGCIASTEFTIPKIEASSNRDRRFQ